MLQVYECALVDDSSGAYSGFTITNTVFVANASCPNELISGEGIVYPPVNSSCLLVYFTDRQNEPMNPAYKQLQYDVRSQGWYQKVKSTGLPSTYGAFKEPAYNQEGIGIAIPVYGEDNQFLGAVEVFMQTVILTRSNLAKGVNMSYLMTSDRTVIGTSENPIASLTIDGAPIEAIDYVNAVVAASASYIVGNAIYLQNVYLSPLSEALMMQMAISHALIPTRSSINWVVVSVTVLKSQHPSPVVTPVNPSQPGGDNSSSGNSSSSLSGLELAAIVVGSLGLAGFVLVLAMWLYSRQTATQLSHTAAQKTAAAAEVELGAMDTVNPIAHSTVP